MKKNKLGEVAQGRDNNLNIMRFVAALMVILCHAYPLTLGKGNADFFDRFSQGSVSLGGLAVSLFFVVGGYLIAKSVVRVQNGKRYFKARVLRIFPSLLFVVLLSALVIGPFLSTLSAGEYYTSPQTWKYLLNGILIPVHELPGVFSQSVYDPTVNGPLWTLPVEFACYILCFLVYKLRLLTPKRFPFVLAAGLIGAAGGFLLFKNAGSLLGAIRPTLLFLIGMGYYVYRDYIWLNVWGAIGAAIVSVPLFWAGLGDLALLIFFPYIVFYLAFGTKYKFSDFGKRGEFSYGIYLWGWPVQQLLCQVFGGTMNVWLNFLLASVIALILAVITYYCVEKPVLKWGK